MFSEDEYLFSLRTALKDQIETLTSDKITKSREISLVITKLEEACMWLGKEMTYKGLFKPYTDEEQKND